MKPRKTSIILTLGFVSIALLPNHDIFNFLFQGTPLVIWKQLLGVTLMALSFIYLETAKANNGSLSRIRLLQRLLLIFAFFAASLSYFNGLPLTRIAYGTISYLGFAGVLGFVHACLVRNKLFPTLNLFFYVGLFCSLGIVLDYFFPFLDFLPRASGNEFETQFNHGYLRRASFLFGASTTVFPFLSFSIVAILIMLQQEKTKKNIIKFILLSSLSVLAIYLTGSRANLILMLAFLAVAFVIAFTFLSPEKKAILVIPIVFIPTLLDFVFSFVYQGGALADRYSDVLSDGDEGNSHRFEVWKAGLALFNEFGPNFIAGNGIGSSLGMLDDGFYYTTHYESSVFQSFSEGGIFGLLLRFLPLFFATAFLVLKKRAWSPIEKVILLWMGLYFVSVSVAPTAAAYHTQFVYFFSCGLALQLPMVNMVLKYNQATTAAPAWGKGNYVKGRVQRIFRGDKA